MSAPCIDKSGVYFLFFLFAWGGGVESKLGPLGTSATTGLLYLPRVIVMMESLLEWILAGETEVLWENLPQRHFVHHNPTCSNPDRRGGKPATNCLSCCVAIKSGVSFASIPEFSTAIILKLLVTENLKIKRRICLLISWCLWNVLRKLIKLSRESMTWWHH
jgi:hypothetical protein